MHLGLACFVGQVPLMACPTQARESKGPMRELNANAPDPLMGCGAWDTPRPKRLAAMLEANCRARCRIAASCSPVNYTAIGGRWRAALSSSRALGELLLIGELGFGAEEGAARPLVGLRADLAERVRILQMVVTEGTCSTRTARWWAMLWGPASSPAAVSS